MYQSFEAETFFPESKWIFFGFILEIYIKKKKKKPYTFSLIIVEGLSQ